MRRDARRAGLHEHTSNDAPDRTFAEVLTEVATQRGIVENGRARARFAGASGGRAKGDRCVAMGPQTHIDYASAMTMFISA